MRSLPKDHITNRLRKLQQGLRHAFSTQAVAPPLAGEDLELMERVADALVTRGMGTPAMLFLESMGPMNFLGSQALHALTPLIECVFHAKDFERLACLLERRDTMVRLAALIERQTSLRRASAR